MAAALEGSYRSHQVYFNIIEARNIRAVEKDGKSDPFVTASCVLKGKTVEVVKTHHITLTSHPQWWVDCTVDMEAAASDISFKMYDWNKVLKDKKIGEAVMSHGAITAEGSYHKLDLGKDNGTLLVFAKRFISDHNYDNFPQAGPPTRALFDSVHRQTVHPDELMRVGYLVRVKKPINLMMLHFKLDQTNCKSSPDTEMRSWSTYMRSHEPAEWKSAIESGDSDAINAKHRPYGANLNVLPKTLCAGIHYFQLELSYPSQDSCGRFICGGTSDDVDSVLSLGLHVDAEKGDPSKDEFADASPYTRIAMKSDYYHHIKPTLPPAAAFAKNKAGMDDEALFLSKVEIKWATPEEGRNRISPLPPHLYFPESISEEERKRWYLSDDEDTKDAQGQERLYANLVWFRQEEQEKSRRQSAHYLVLSEVTIDDTDARTSSIVRDLNLEYSVRLVCDRYRAGSPDSDPERLIYNLTPTKAYVGKGKREYHVASADFRSLHPIYSIPKEVAGHLQTAYVYIEVIATTPTDSAKLWVMQRRPFFAECSSNIAAPPSTMKPVEPVAATGHFKVNYTHYPFIDRAPEVVGDFGAPNVAAFGPDRLVRLMAPATGPIGSIIDDAIFTKQNGTFSFTDALATPQEGELFEFKNIGAPVYAQHKSFDKPSAPES